MPQPHETIREWDGRIDGFLLINQMMSLKNEILLQREPQRPKLQNKSEAYKVSQPEPKQPVVDSKPKPQPSSSSNQTKASNSNSVPDTKFELNPKHKLSRKPKEQEGTESDYVLKHPAAPKKDSAPKAIDVADLEKNLCVEQKPSTKVPTSQPVDIESIEQGLKSQAVSMNVEDLEKGFLNKSAPQPTDIEEIEAQMQKASKK